MGSNQNRSEGQQKVVRYLKRPKELESAIWRKQETINELKECLLPHGAKYDNRGGGSSSHSGDKTADIMAKVIDLDADLDQLKKNKGLLPYLKFIRRLNCWRTKRKGRLSRLYISKV